MENADNDAAAPQIAVLVQDESEAEVVENNNPNEQQHEDQQEQQPPADESLAQVEHNETSHSIARNAQEYNESYQEHYWQHGPQPYDYPFFGAMAMPPQFYGNYQMNYGPHNNIYPAQPQYFNPAFPPDMQYGFAAQQPYYPRVPPVQPWYNANEAVQAGSSYNQHEASVNPEGDGETVALNNKKTETKKQKQDNERSSSSSRAVNEQQNEFNPTGNKSSNNRDALSLVQYYEARAAAFANAAANAAFAAAQAAQSVGVTENITRNATSNIHSAHAITPVSRTRQLDSNSHSNEVDTQPEHQGRRRRSLPKSDSNDTYVDDGRHLKKQYYQNNSATRSHPQVSPRIWNSSIGCNVQPSRQKVRRRRWSSDNDSSSDGSGAYKRRVAKEACRTISDASIIGKPAVSALYEWCSKRYITPSFVPVVLKSDKDQRPGDEEKANEECFAWDVYIDDKCYGRESGYSKRIAKQWAAQKALLALIPGLKLDPSTGIVQSLPEASAHSTAEKASKAYCDAEALAPNLAKQLAIGHLKDDDGDNVAARSKRSKQPRRCWTVYPWTSTTSDDEDDSQQNLSRLNNVYSDLLNVMVQINDRVITPPIYTYEAISSHPRASLKGNSTTKYSAPYQPRPSTFNCTARLSVVNDSKSSQNDDNVIDKKDEGDTEQVEKSHDVLECVGSGSTKREARKHASATLLSLLFPECKDMEEVRAAAETYREAHAKKKQQVNTRHDGNDNRTQIATVKQAESLQASVLVSVNDALKRLNDQEDVGQSVTVDDVGKTVLRLAEQDDVFRIERLLNKRGINPVSLSNHPQYTGVTTYDDGGGIGKPLTIETLTQMIKTSIVLLLCRAIAVFEDPPLGCAVLTVVSSVPTERTLRLRHVGFESHLPPERFLECLHALTDNMQYTLDLYDENAEDELHVECNIDKPKQHTPSNHLYSQLNGTLLPTMLQSVREESEVSDASSNAENKRGTTKPRSKPSKRSRVN